MASVSDPSSARYCHVDMAAAFIAKKPPRFPRAVTHVAALPACTPRLFRRTEDDSAQALPIYLAVSTHFSTGPIEKAL